MIQAIALDDEPIALEVIKAFCDKVPFIELTQTFTQASLAEKHMRKFPIDLLFLDIQMPDVNGITFSKSLPQKSMVVFTTAHSNFAIEGFEVNALDFILKPFKFERFENACLKAKEHYEFYKSTSVSSEDFLLVRSEYALVKIPHAHILYLETMDDYIKIHQMGKKPILTLMSMKKILEKLPERDFIRTHRSFIVPLHKIESVRGKSIHLGVTEIPIGGSYEENFFRRYIEI